PGGQRGEGGKVRPLAVILGVALRLRLLLRWRGEPRARVRVLRYLAGMRLVGTLERPRGADEFVQFLSHAVHVNGQRYAAVADKPQPYLAHQHRGGAHISGICDYFRFGDLTGHFTLPLLLCSPSSIDSLNGSSVGGKDGDEITCPTGRELTGWLTVKGA